LPGASSRRSFDDLVDEAVSEPVEGWDFAFVHGRTTEQPLPWNYEGIGRGLVMAAQRVLDVDTGGGEVFGSLRPPAGSVAVEPYHPNVAIATRLLNPLGVSVVERTDDGLPVGDAAFDLVLNRHGSLHPGETSRVLAPGGRLLTQQVGPRTDLEFNEALGIPPAVDPAVAVGLDQVIGDLEGAGLTVIDAQESNVVRRYLDVGAVVFQLRAVPWQAPGFDVERHHRELRRVHDQITDDGGFEVRSQRFLIQAQK
jgi:SAM-dependent methyltransferase